jgi:hypothetical protein
MARRIASKPAAALSAAVAAALLPSRGQQLTADQHADFASRLSRAAAAHAAMSAAKVRDQRRETPKHRRSK